VVLKGCDYLKITFYLQKVEVAILTEGKVNADYHQQTQSSSVEICDYEEELLAA
jgi:hypothetical protein